MPKQHKPKRIVTQKAADTICTYASLVNLFQSRKKIGTYTDFSRKIHKMQKELFLNGERAAMAKRRISKALSIPIQDVTNLQVMEKLKDAWDAHWKQLHGSGGFSPNVIKGLVSQDFGIETSQEDYHDCKNAILQVQVGGANGFMHAICIRNGYVIESIDDVTFQNMRNLPTDGVYPWDGTFQGYRRQPQVMSAFVYPDDMFD